jgi:phosphoglycerol transferase
VAYLFFPEIRTYTRISIFIAFFSILTIVLLLDFLIRKSTFSKVVIFALMVGVLVVGINDQTSANFVPDYQGIKTEFLSDRHFVESIETKFPADNMVFQLPYVSFPEGSLTYHMSDYDLFRGYLHSTTIHWSYGAMKGRYGDFWQSNISSKPVAEMVQELSFAGFNGIYVDSNGYEDGGKELLASLSSILNNTPLNSDNDRLYFFDMTLYNAQLKSQFTAEEYEQQKLNALYPLYIEFRDGFLPMEGNQDDNIRFCTSQGELFITNFTDKDRTITIDATFETGYNELSALKIESSLVTKVLLINGAGFHYTDDFTVPPGNHIIKLSCDAQYIYFPRYQKDIVFAIVNFRLTGK